MVKDNWSNLKEQQNVNTTQIDTTHPTAHQSLANKQQNQTASGSGSTPIDSVQSNVWGEYGSKSNLIDMHFC